MAAMLLLVDIVRLRLMYEKENRPAAAMMMIFNGLTSLSNGQSRSVVSLIAKINIHTSLETGWALAKGAQ